MKKHLLIVSIFLLGALISHAQWEPDVRLTNNPDFSDIGSMQCIASSGDTVHVVWSDNRDAGNNEIYYKRSTDGGVSWGPDTRISNNVYSSVNPSISVSGKVVHVVWNDIDTECFISYNRSTDGGTNWGTDTRLANVLAYTWGTSVSASGSEVHVVWEDFQTVGYIPVIYYKRSIDGGISWSADTPLTNEAVDSRNPAVSCSGLEVHVVWTETDQDYAYWQIYYKNSADGGINWGESTLLTSDTAKTSSPSVSVSGSSIHVLCLDEREYPYNQIYYKNSADGGISWGADTWLTNNFTSKISSCAMSVSGSNIHIVWEVFGDGNNNEIYYNHSTNGGLTWGTETLLTNNSTKSNGSYPFVSASGSAVHVVWMDNRDGNSEIYYKRNPTGDFTGLKVLSSSDMQFTVFPNPAITDIKVRSLENVNELSIKDIYGKEVYHINIVIPTHELRIPVSDFPAGIYFIQLKNGNRKSTQKLIKH